MRINGAKLNRSAGQILVVTLVISAILGFTLAAFLILVETRSKSVARSQLWNETMVVTEAGIEDAFAFINKFVNVTTVSNATTLWTTTYAVDGWTNSGNVYSVQRYVDDAKTKYYVVYITNFTSGPIIRSTGYVPGPSWISGGPPISRTVLIGTERDTYFNAAMAALGTIDLKGNNIATDSFDSSATNYPGYWTNTIRSANGDVVTDSIITNSVLNVGNANVAGHIKTGPGGNLQYNANVSVGDLPWVDASTPGIKPGYYSDDMNVLFKDVKIPDVTWWAASGAGTGGAGTVNGKSYAHVFNSAASGGYYTVSDSGDIYVGTNVTVTIKVPTSVGTFAPNYLFVAGTGDKSGKFVAYIDCASVTLGTTDKPQSGNAGNMAFLGTPNCTSLSYKGNGDFTGVMYMPQADFQLAGGGSGIVDFIGSSVTRTVQMNGHYHFHFDEALRKWAPEGPYVAAFWREL